ncbi:MAG: hypothetical protein AAFY19_00320 [Pseudomonadota bacterium]
MLIPTDRLAVATSSMFPYRKFPSDLSALTVDLDDGSPWLATVVERLDTDAPASARPWCCYTKTVIFYEQPWRVLPDRRAYAEHDRVETVLDGEDILTINGVQFELLGGIVSHDGAGWIMTRRARKRADDRQVPLPHR